MGIDSMVQCQDNIKYKAWDFPGAPVPKDYIATKFNLQISIISLASTICLTSSEKKQAPSASVSWA